MAMDTIKSAAMTYQGSVSTAETKAESQPKVEAAEAAPEPAEAKLVDDGTDSNTSQGIEQQRNAQIKKAVDEVNKKAVNSEAIFGIHEATNRVTIKIIDKDSRKVIKEIPPEKTLDMIAKVWELAGLMVDEKL